MSRLVSILIDNYNYARFLRRAVDSALAQTHPTVEVIVVDDGSTDESPEIIHSYGDRIRAVFKGNGGQASAFNAGFAVASGEIVAFLDADDYLLPNAIERIVTAWSPRAPLVHYRLLKVNEAGRPIGYVPPLDQPLAAGDVLPELLWHGLYTAPPSSGLAYGREVLQKILPMPEEDFHVAADLYLVLAAPFFGRVVALEGPLASYRIHGANDSGLAGSRRAWTRRRLEKARELYALRCKWLPHLAAWHGVSPPDPARFEKSENVFEEMLLARIQAGRPGFAEGGELFRRLLAAVRREAAPRARRLRFFLLGLAVWCAPRFFLARFYPGLFAANAP